MDDKEQRTYLGDGLYVEYDGLLVTLSTERYGNSLTGTSTLHFVCLEPHVLSNFLAYIDRLSEFNRT